MVLNTNHLTVFTVQTFKQLSLITRSHIMSDTSNRGFASMDEDKQREIASKGGQAAHEKGTAHEFTSEEAREAGQKGGQVAHEKGTAHEFTSEEAREAGQKGGQAAHEKGTAHEFTSEEAREAGRKGGNS
jgi:general stress protein YciG